MVLDFKTLQNYTFFNYHIDNEFLTLFYILILPENYKASVLKYCAYSV